MRFTANNIENHIRSTCGSVLSHVSTSLEKRFSTRPNGVVSKISIGHRNTCFNSNECIKLLAASEPVMKITATVHWAITIHIYMVFCDIFWIKKKILRKIKDF